MEKSLEELKEDFAYHSKRLVDSRSEFLGSFKSIYHQLRAGFLCRKILRIYGKKIIEHAYERGYWKEEELEKVDKVVRSLSEVSFRG